MHTEGTEGDGTLCETLMSILPRMPRPTDHLVAVEEVGLVS